MTEGEKQPAKALKPRLLPVGDLSPSFIWQTCWWKDSSFLCASSILILIAFHPPLEKVSRFFSFNCYLSLVLFQSLIIFLLLYLHSFLFFLHSVAHPLSQISLIIAVLQFLLCRSEKEKKKCSLLRITSHAHHSVVWNLRLSESIEWGRYFNVSSLKRLAYIVALTKKSNTEQHSSQLCILADPLLVM